MDTKIIWKQINGYPDYDVSNTGLVRNRKGNTYRILSISTQNGYSQVCLGVIHRLVAIAFIPNPDNKPEINHKNLIKTDNRVENLEWCTHQENMAHFYQSNDFRGVNNPNARLTQCDITNIRKLRTKKKLKELASIYNVSEGHISCICNNKRW